MFCGIVWGSCQCVLFYLSSVLEEFLILLVVG